MSSSWKPRAQHEFARAGKVETAPNTRPMDTQDIRNTNAPYMHIVSPWAIENVISRCVEGRACVRLRVPEATELCYEYGGVGGVMGNEI